MPRKHVLACCHPTVAILLLMAFTKTVWAVSCPIMCRQQVLPVPRQSYGGKAEGTSRTCSESIFLKGSISHTAFLWEGFISSNWHYRAEEDTVGTNIYFALSFPHAPGRCASKLELCKLCLVQPLLSLCSEHLAGQRTPALLLCQGELKSQVSPSLDVMEQVASHWAVLPSSCILHEENPFLPPSLTLHCFK